MKSAETVPANADAPQWLRVGDLQLNLRDQIVRRGSRRLPVSGRSFRLLQFLVESYPQTASHRELLESVWSGVVVTGHVLPQRVRLLRKALGDDRGDDGYIVAVHGQGYRLSQAPVSGAAENQVRVRFAIPGIMAWIILAMMVSLLMILLDSRMPHAFKHLFRHLW